MKDNEKALVATGHPLVSQAAVDILAQGGNAFDAAVAAGFAGAVAEPALTSLGGGGFLLARTSAGDEILFDFFADTPGKGLSISELEPHFFPVTVNFSGSDQEFNIGLGSVAVPGNLKGFIHVHQRLGSLELAEVVAPAVRMARCGITVNSHQAYFFDLLTPIMTLSDQGRILHAPKGKYLTEGDRFKNPDLADFLEHLPADRGESFYAGALARRIESDMRHGRGLLTAQDLASYHVIEREPLAVPYRGRRLLTNPPPSFGGTLINAALRLLEQFTLTSMDWGSSDHLVILASVMQEIERHRDAGKGGASGPDRCWYPKAAAGIRRFVRGTTHVSVVDTLGNVASMTTSNGEGSGYIVPGTGIMLNNMMGEDDLHPDGFHASPPGERVASMMSPSILVKDGRVELVLGSGGSKRIRTAITQVLSHVVDFGLSVKQAVDSPRLHWDGSALQVEPGFADDALAALKKKWPLNVWDDLEVYFGGAHVVAPGKEGAGDPRRGGDAREIELPGPQTGDT